MIIDLDKEEAYEFFVGILGVPQLGDSPIEFNLNELDEEFISGWLEAIVREIRFRTHLMEDTKCLVRVLEKFEKALTEGGKERIVLQIFEQAN